MARTGYQYTTSPKKLEPDYHKKSQKQKAKLKVVKELPRQEVMLSKEQKRRQIKLTLVVIAIFALLLTISYRNSQINVKFSNLQDQKRELSALEKENEQLKVNIENGLNLNTIEKLAKEKLGMQKLTNRQTIYVTLPKKDYIEAPTEKVVIEEESWFEKMVNKIFHK